MKTITILGGLLIGTLLCGEAAYAQQNRWTVDVSGGVSLALGAFGRKDITDSTSGFAKTGPVINLSGSYRIMRHFGITVLVGIQKNAVANEAIVNALEKADTGYTFASSQPDWKLGRVLGGVYWQYSLDHKKHLSVVIKGLAGVMKVGFPTRKLLQEDFSNFGGVVAEANASYKINKLQFACQAGAGLHYALTRRWFLEADADYVGAIVHVPYVPFVFASKADPGTPPFTISFGSGPITPPTGYRTSYTQPLAMVNIGLGVGVIL